MRVELARAAHADKRLAGRGVGTAVEDAAHTGRGRPQMRPARRQQLNRGRQVIPLVADHADAQRLRRRMSEYDIEDWVLRTDDGPGAVGNGPRAQAADVALELGARKLLKHRRRPRAGPTQAPPFRPARFE